MFSNFVRQRRSKPRCPEPSTRARPARANAHSPAVHAKVFRAPQAEIPAGTIYTCPMHPEIRQIGPGHCPKCGMALEPLMPTETVDDSEIRSVRRRFWIALALAIPVV